MPLTEDEALRDVLDAETVAVVGCSTAPGKAAHDVPHYLLERGYEVIPVNPHADEIFGREAVDSIGEVRGEIDVLDVFRPSDEVPDIVDEALERDDIETVWLQLGITDDESGERVEASGRKFVQDRCLKVQHGRLVAD
jgi:predicted CoA-binding protein